MPQPTQAPRHIAITTPLGDDVLLLQRFSGREEISALFEFDLDLLSEDDEINFDDIIGQNVTISMEQKEGGKRYWNGFISRFVQGVSTSTKFAQYRATMVPWLWFLTRTSDCRIFQEKTVPEIVKQIFNDQGFSDIEDRLSGSYQTLVFCVQYRETDFAFVSRLMEQEGIYYYFRHKKGKCTIVLCDSLSKHDPYGGYEKIDFAPDVNSSAIPERITAWTLDKQVRSGKFAHTDYNFAKPSTSLMSAEENPKGHARADYEIYEYPGRYPEKADGDKYARVRMEALAQPHEICSGQSDARGICAGHLFSLAKHTRGDQNREYLVVSTQYQAAAKGYETTGGQEEPCVCAFTAIPGTIQFRPARTTPKPAIHGTQTAIVTGPSGEEIYTDEHGRVKVQFHWDREGKFDENSSCWIRVSQQWAGAGWGAMFIPHIRQEVIVDFEEGDPDRPLITGRVYNGNSKPGDALPENKTRSVIRSWGDNDIIIEDKEGDKHIQIKQANGNEIILHEGTPSIDINQACGNFIHMRDGEGIHIKDHAGNEVVLDSAGAFLRLHSPTHDSTLELGKSIQMKTNSNWISNIVGDAKHDVKGDLFEVTYGNKNDLVKGKVNVAWDGAEVKLHGGAVSDTFIGVKHESLLGAKITLNAAKEVNKNALSRDRKATGHLYYGSASYIKMEGGGSDLMLSKASAGMKSGSSMLKIDKSGDIILKTSAKVHINASGGIILEGPDCTIKSKTTIKKFFKSPNIKDDG